MNLNDLLDFSKCTSLSEVENQFFLLSNELMLKNIISNKERTKHYLISNLELFIDYHEAGVIDPYIYNVPEQQDSRTWLVVNKGIHLPSRTFASITCGKENKYLASLKIDGIVEISRFLNDEIKFTPSDRINPKYISSGPAEAFRMLLFGEKIEKKRGLEWSKDELKKIDEIRSAPVFCLNSIFSIQPKNIEDISIYTFEINLLNRKPPPTNENKNSKSNFNGDYEYSLLDREKALHFKFRSELCLLPTKK